MTPNVVVLDAVMSGLDGFATCRRIKQNPRFAHLPVIFLTGLKDTGHVLMGLEAGGVDYVVKPVIIEELVARIRIHVSNAKAAFGARVALDATGRHLLAIDRGGRLLWCTPQAADLLATRFGPFEILRSQPPESFSALLRDAAERRDHDAPAAAGPVCVSFLCEIGGEELLFRLTEPQSVSDEALLGAEIRADVARGGGAELAGVRQVESRHRRNSLHLAAHGAQASGAHFREARRRQPLLRDLGGAADAEGAGGGLIERSSIWTEDREEALSFRAIEDWMRGQSTFRDGAARWSF